MHWLSYIILQICLINIGDLMNLLFVIGLVTLATFISILHIREMQKRKKEIKKHILNGDIVEEHLDEADDKVIKMDVGLDKNRYTPKTLDDLPKPKYKPGM